MMEKDSRRNSLDQRKIGDYSKDSIRRFKIF